MKVNVAGAGAGKTTQMADIIMGYKIPEGKKVFCIAFTNAAADNIREKVVGKLGEIPSNLKISTIHSFLYQELIEPYYYFLYGEHFDRLSVIGLPTENAYKRNRISELEKAKILHFTTIPERAKWLAYKKSRDTKAIEKRRQSIILQFSSYCAAIFIDEAQDINGDISAVIDALSKSGVEIILYGDPKQDVKGLGYFRKIIDEEECVSYIPACYRCPQMHLNLSNMLAPQPEKQIADKGNATGSISIVFESDISIQEFIDSGEFGLRYISSKRDRYETHEKRELTERFDTLFHEVYRAVNDKWRGEKSELEIKRAAYYITEKMLEKYDATGDPSGIIAHWSKTTAFDRLSGQRYAQMITAFTPQENDSVNGVAVSSIEIVKGLEAKRCLFVLTTDLAPYLFQEKTDDNKMRHLLYVALTRSLDHLTILITKEVEEKYSKEQVMGFFREQGVL
ncbi:MAG: AAA family ATPase [Oscillospiraceae bacterium]|nr:AAA family ATPase [Oscillospiraceae bacterium]